MTTQDLFTKSPVFAAQFKTMSAALKISEAAERFTSVLIEKGLASKATVNLETYNAGHEVKIDVMVNYEELSKLSDNLRNTLFNVSSCYLYPGSYFNENVKRVNLGGELTGSLPVRNNDSTYILKRVFNADGIDAVVFEWQNNSINQFDTIIARIRTEMQ